MPGHNHTRTRTIISTVGTSLLSNCSKDQGRIPNDSDLANFLRHSEPIRACAESNSISRMVQAGDRLIFLSSNTPDGERCARCLEAHFSKLNSCSIERIDRLNYQASQFKMLGLRDLVAKLIKLVREERKNGREVLLNPTGGFKAEIAYATLVGLLFDVPVYYIHEAFPDIIEMPPTPIGWDYSLIALHDELLEWIAADLRRSNEVESRLLGNPSAAKLRLLLTEEDGFTFLSPTGDAFYESYQEHLQSAQGAQVYLSDNAFATLNAADADTQALFERTLRKLALKELWIAGGDRVHGSDCVVFPKGHRNERVFFYEDDDGAVRVCELSRHSDQSYERLMKKGIFRAAYSLNNGWRLQS